MQQQITYPQFIPGILEGYDVVGIPEDALGVITGWEHVSTQVRHVDILMMRMFGKQLQHAFVVLSFFHQITCGLNWDHAIT